MRRIAEVGAAVIGTGFIGTVHVEALRRIGVQVRGVLGSTGDGWEGHFAAIHIVFGQYRRGALQGAIAESRRVHQAGVEIGDRHAMAAVLEVWSKASGGALPAELLEQAHTWLAGNRCDNWALTDLLGTKVLAPLLQRSPALAEQLKEWAASRNLWVRRAALVALVPPAGRGQHLALAYSIATRLQRDKNDLIQKAAGWLLRECGETNPRRLATYLLAHGPHVPRTTLRYATERFPKAQRDEILERTRTAGAA